MKKFLLYIICVVCTLSIMFISSCSQEEMSGFEKDGPHTCKLIFNASVNSFGGKANTRAASGNSEAWENGSVVYLSFVVGANRVDGKAVYGKAEDE